MKQKKVWIFILIAVTAVIAAVHLCTREKVPEGALRVQSGEETFYIEPGRMSGEKVSGTVINGRGEKKEIQVEGISLCDALSGAGIDVEEISSVRVTAEDEFSAELTGAETRESGKAYLYLDEEKGGISLVVFGDDNAKRRVHRVERIDVQ